MKMTKKLITLALAALMLLSLALPAMAADSVITKATVTKTNIKADGVSNKNGYGDVYIGGDDDSHPQVALIDKTGKFVFGYRESYSSFSYDPDSGIVSLTPGSCYIDGDFYPVDYSDEAVKKITAKTYPTYYNLDGSVAFSLPPKGNTTYKAGPMSNGLAVVMEITGSGGNEKYSAYVVDKTGKTVFTLPSEFSEIVGYEADGTEWKSYTYGFSDGLAIYYEYDEDGESYYPSMGFIDATGKTVLELPDRFAYAYGFSDGLARVHDANIYKEGYIDKTGKLVIPCQYAISDDFSHGLAAVVNDEGDLGFIDKTGKTVIPFEYDYNFNYAGAGDGLLTVVKNYKYGLINTKNEVVVPLEYDSMSTYENGVAYAVKDGYVYIITADESAPETPTTPSFADVPANAWYAKPVAWAVEKGITNGTSKDTFSPEKTCNTAEILTFLWRACNKPSAPAANLSDVDSGAWYSDAANWAKSKGMISGNKLSPDTPCTRASAVMFIWQAMGKPTASKTASFSDVPANSDYAAAVAWAVEKGVTNGTGADTFSPDDICTRGHIVTFLQRAYAE